jgi:hypothetical protein
MILHIAIHVQIRWRYQKTGASASARAAIIGRTNGAGGESRGTSTGGT